MGGLLLERRWHRDVQGASQRQLFEIVSDVESYPGFIPGCVGARILQRDAEQWLVENSYGLGPLRQSFVSRAHVRPPHSIDIASPDMPWGSLTVAWRFEPSPRGCRVDCHTRLGFHSRLTAVLAGLVIGDIERSVIAAFERRAAETSPPRSPRASPPQLG